MGSEGSRKVSGVAAAGRSATRRWGGARLCMGIALTVGLLSPRAATSATLRGKVEIRPVSRPQQAAFNPYPGAMGSMHVHDTAPSLDDPRDLVVSLQGAPEAAEKPSSEHRRMEQVNQSFRPRVLAIPVGTTVDFPNLDPIFHNAFSYSKTKRFDLGKYGQGKSESVTFNKPGVVQIFCDIHSNMSAYIYVADTAHVTQPDGKGQFVLPDIPKGKYTLRLWHPE